MSSPLISVVVCTYNRANLLAIVLESLNRQTLDKSLYEMIIVDNNSSDHTREVAKAFCRCDPNVRYVLEEKQGLSHARNRGWQEARGAYVGYIDDDGKAPEQWLAVAKEIITTHAPGAFGGPYYAFYNSPKPKWWRDEYRSLERTANARPLKEGEYLSGGNMFFRRGLLSELGGFDPRFGMAGNRISVGEETQFIMKVRETKPRELIYYDPRQFIYHLVHEEKMMLRWLVHFWFNSGRSLHHVFNSHHAVRRDQLGLKMARTAVEFIGCTSWGVIHRDRKRYPYIQNYIFEVSSRHVQKLGVLYERWRLAEG